jgi:hypothetical protein
MVKLDKREPTRTLTSHELLRSIHHNRAVRMRRIKDDANFTRGSCKDYVSLINHLRAASASVVPTGSVTQPFYSVYGQAIMVNGEQVQALTEAGWVATAIAQALNEAGFRPSRSNTGFRAQTITQLQRQLGVKAPRPQVRHHDDLSSDEWWLPELARLLGIPRGSLSHWIRQGVVRARQLDEPLHRWVVWADKAEQERLRAYHQRPIGDDFRHRWTDASLAEPR